MFLCKLKKEIQSLIVLVRDLSLFFPYAWLKFCLFQPGIIPCIYLVPEVSQQIWSLIFRMSEIRVLSEFKPEEAIALICCETDAL